MWLRDRAEQLRTSAGQADRAYSTGGFAQAAQYVANKYRRAAVLLEEAATLVEDDPGALDLTRTL
jgi:hypothetical protein